MSNVDNVNFVLKEGNFLGTCFGHYINEPINLILDYKKNSFSSTSFYYVYLSRAL